MGATRPHGCTPALPSFPIPPQILEKGSPYPLIILPQFGGYWIEDPENLGTPTSSDSSICEEEEENLSPSTYGYKLECKGEARAYRKHFLGKVGARGSKEAAEKCSHPAQEKKSNPTIVSKIGKFYNLPSCKEKGWLVCSSGHCAQTPAGARGGAGQSPAVCKLSHLNLLSLFVGPFKFLLYGQQPGKSDSFY